MWYQSEVLLQCLLTYYPFRTGSILIIYFFIMLFDLDSRCCFRSQNCYSEEWRKTSCKLYH